MGIPGGATQFKVAFSMVDFIISFSLFLIRVQIFENNPILIRVFILTFPFETRFQMASVIGTELGISSYRKEHNLLHWREHPTMSLSTISS